MRVFKLELFGPMDLKNFKFFENIASEKIPLITACNSMAFLQLTYIYSRNYKKKLKILHSKFKRVMILRGSNANVTKQQVHADIISLFVCAPNLK